MKRVIWFLRLVFRPHPYAYPGLSLREAWTKGLLWPREAWRLAGLYAQTPGVH